MKWLAHPLGTPSSFKCFHEEARRRSGFYPLLGPGMLYYFKTLALNCVSLRLLDETLKAFYMPGEVKYPTQEVNVLPVVDSTFFFFFLRLIEEFYTTHCRLCSQLRAAV